MKKVLFTLIGVLGICLGLTINMNDTVHAANPVVVDYAVSATYTGWVSNSDGTYSYYIDGTMVCSEVIEIGTKYYAFTYDGIMYADQEFYLDGAYYRAKEDGTLFQNEWHLDYDGTYYYYGDDCKAPYNEIREIRGNDYYFSYDGSMLANGGVNYYIQTAFEYRPMAADANGHLTVIPNNKWTQVGSYWYYVQDGVFLGACSATIDGTKYVFDNYYRLLENDNTVAIWEERGAGYIQCYYRAKAGGELYRNQWYQDKEGNWYYYDNDGRSIGGMMTISGKQYYFDFDGKLVVNDFIAINDKLYACLSDGTMLEVSGTRWVQLGSDWYYVKDSNIVCGEIAKISGKYYCFDYDGHMVTGRTFYSNNPYVSMSIYGRAKADGTLYHNEWYQDEEGDWYYYLDNCTAAEGLCTIGGKKYYFDWTGYMYTNTWITIGNDVYYAQENGEVIVLKNNSWTSIGDDWYYVKDGRIPWGEVVLIAGNYYGFDYDGKMRKDADFGGWDSSDNYVNYRAKADGKLCRNQWYQNENEYWYYYGNDATRVSGLQTIGGNLYYFGDSMYTSGSVYVDGTNYVIQKNGVAVPLKNNAWTTVEGEWYYVKDGELPCYEILLIGGKYYAFDYDGAMYADEQGYVYGEDYSGYCRANADGTLLRNQWYQTKYDAWFYYGADCIGLKGINTVGGKKYYFDYDGEMYTSGYAYGENGAYLIGKDGVLIETPGWNSLNGQWYYMNSDGTLYYGLLSKGNTLYYMNYYMYKNSDMFTVDGVLYQAKDSTGALTKLTSNGWHRDRWASYYVSNGKVVTGWKQIDGKWYYFYNDGSMAYDNWLIINEAKYVFDQNGVMYSNTWLPDGQRYATSSGALATGVYIINGKKYYFDSEGYLDSTIYINNGKYIINGKEYTFKNGWNQVGSDWYYVAGDELASGLWEIGGKYYYFDYSTYAMVTNEIHNSRYFGEDGAAICKGWFQVAGYWYYADKDSGYLASGLTEINDKEYYFSNYIMQTTDIISGSTIYRIASDGVVKSTEKAKNGWYYVDCEAYYYKDGIRYTGWLGESYIEDGIKVISGIAYDYKNDAYYYIGSDGNCVYNKWINIENTYYYYAGSDGKLKVNEWLYYSGSWYYFSGYSMHTGVLEEDGKSYYFGKDGKLKKTFSTVSDGWHSVDGEWLFASDGRFVSGSKYISGKYYYFFDEGMIDNKVVHYSSGTHIYDSQGHLVQKQGWYSVDGEWYYTNANGTSIHGWIELGGKKYYLDPYMITGYKVVNNKLYYFDDQGVCKGNYGVANGWYSAGGNWYYFENEKVVCSDTRILGGKIYAFNYEGLMVTNDIAYSYIDYAYHYFGSDGAMVTKSGIYTDTDGYKVYVSSNGKAYTGTVYINGKIQNMRDYK